MFTAGHFMNGILQPWGSQVGPQQKGGKKPIHHVGGCVGYFYFLKSFTVQNRPPLQICLEQQRNQYVKQQAEKRWDTEACDATIE